MHNVQETKKENFLSVINFPTFIDGAIEKEREKGRHMGEGERVL